MSQTSLEVEVGRQRLRELRAATAALLRRVRRFEGRSTAALRGLVRALRQTLRWVAFKVEMLGIASGAHRSSVREELEVVFAVADQHSDSVQRYLAARPRQGQPQ